MSKELKKYIETAMEKGASKQQIIETLLNSGWAKDMIEKIIDNFSGTDADALTLARQIISNPEVLANLESALADTLKNNSNSDLSQAVDERINDF